MLFSLLLSLTASSVPLAGALFFGWDAWNILFLYWVEMIVLSVFYFVRIWQAKGKTMPGESYGWKINKQPIEKFGSRQLAFKLIQFLITFSALVAVTLFGLYKDAAVIRYDIVYTAIATYVLQQALSYIVDFRVKGERLTTSPQYQWSKSANEQIMFLFVLVFGAFFFKSSPLGIIGIFTVVEIGTIYYSYHKNRKYHV